MKEEEEEKIARDKTWDRVELEDRRPLRAVDRTDKRLHGEERAGEDDRGEETTRQLLSRSPGSQALFIPKAAVLLDHPRPT